MNTFDFDEEVLKASTVKSLILRTTHGDIKFEVLSEQAVSNVKFFKGLVLKSHYRNLVINQDQGGVLVLGGVMTKEGTYEEPNYKNLGRPYLPEVTPHPYFKETLSFSYPLPEDGTPQLQLTQTPHSKLPAFWSPIAKLVQGRDVLRRLRIGDKVYELVFE